MRLQVAAQSRHLPSRLSVQVHRVSRAFLLPGVRGRSQRRDGRAGRRDAGGDGPSPQRHQAVPAPGHTAPRHHGTLPATGLRTSSSSVTPPLVMLVLMSMCLLVLNGKLEINVMVGGKIPEMYSHE